MSDQQTLPLEENEEEYLTLEDLNPLWITSDGLPTFVADRSDICECIESFGFNIYYIIANEEKEIKPTNTPSSNTGTVTYNNSNKTATVAAPPVIVKSSQIYRVVNNFVGRTVTIARPELGSDFISVEEEAIYDMPPIPYILIDKLDQFFRLVEAQHGTESIVMLTFDQNKEGSDGWGILVPDQTNTSVHCNYDPDSIAQIKPDNVLIVGSVHSHPGMSAYASGTDHADQADFDGIHITFGWQKSVNNGATQYYIEMQMAGKAYKLDPEDVFEGYTLDKAPDAEVVGWTDKVKKVSPPNMGGTRTDLHGQVLPQPQARTQTTTAAGRTNTQLIGFINYSTHILDMIEEAIGYENQVVLVCEANPSSEKGKFSCPSCFAYVPINSIYVDHCCALCDVPLCEPDTPVDQVVYNMSEYCRDRNISEDAVLYMLTKDIENNFMLLRLTPDLISTYLQDQWLDKDLPTNDEQLTLCCSQKKEDCYCSVQVTTLDAFDFDNFMGKYDVYSKDSDCYKCEHYYTAICPRYSSRIVNYISSPKDKEPEHYADTITSDGCTIYSEYIYERDTYESH